MSPSEQDVHPYHQTPWAEVARLRAELEQARKDAHTCPHSNCDAQRFRDALERIADGSWGANAQLHSHDVAVFARDALAGGK
jgi:hypothetical protein